MKKIKNTKLYGKTIKLTAWQNCYIGDLIVASVTETTISTKVQVIADIMAWAMRNKINLFTKWSDKPFLTDNSVSTRLDAKYDTQVIRNAITAHMAKEGSKLLPHAFFLGYVSLMTKEELCDEYGNPFLHTDGESDGENMKLCITFGDIRLSTKVTIEGFDPECDYKYSPSAISCADENGLEVNLGKWEIEE